MVYEKLESLVHGARAWLCGIYEWVYAFCRSHQKTAFCFGLILAFVIMGLWFYAVPYSNIDDYEFMNNYATGEPLTSILQVVESQQSFWHTHSGRVLAHGLLQIMLYFGKAACAVQMSAVLVLVGVLASKLSNLDGKVYRLPVLLAMALFYYLNPKWEQVLWITGFQVYVVPALPIMLFLYAYMADMRGMKISKILDNGLVLTILAFLSGCSVEAMAGSLGFTCLIMLFCMKKKGVLKSKHISAFVFFALGALLLISAPGNAVRANDVNYYDRLWSFHNICVCIWNILDIFSEGALPTFLLLAVAYHFTDHEEYRKTGAGWYVMIVLVVVLSMLAATQGFVTRTFFTMLPLCLAAFLAMLRCIDFKGNKKFWVGISI